jgi:hypothetical protein
MGLGASRVDGVESDDLLASHAWPSRAGATRC